MDSSGFVQLGILAFGLLTGVIAGAITEGVINKEGTVAKSMLGVACASSFPVVLPLIIVAPQEGSIFVAGHWAGGLIAHATRRK